MVLSLFSSVSFAATEAREAGLINNIQVVDIHNSACQIDKINIKVNSRWVFIDKDSQGIYSLALAAFMAGKSVAVKYDTSIELCPGLGIFKVRNIQFD